MRDLTNIELEEIKAIIKDVMNASLDAMKIKGFAKKLLDNQIESYLEDKDNDVDIQIGFYKMLEVMKRYGILK